jgi:hypothetical protein
MSISTDLLKAVQGLCGIEAENLRKFQKIDHIDPPLAAL